jgi:hypothetical protein
MDFPVQVEGEEPPVIDEELKAKQIKMYDSFAISFAKDLEAVGTDKQEYNALYAKAQENLIPLWPIKLTPEEQKRRDELESLR